MQRPKLRLKTNRIRPDLAKKDRRLSQIPHLAHEEFVRQTPVRTGNARRRTRLQGSTIKADYPYAERLDQGWSRQARDGMSEPTIEFIRRKINEILGR